MRTVIAIESSTPNGSIAVWRDGAVVFEEEFVSERSHNTAIYGPLGRALEMVPEADVIAIGTGPGSYTGVRIGIAAATGIALARGIRVIGLPSGYGMVDVGEVTLTGDARRGGGWVMDLDETVQWGEPEVFPVAEIDGELEKRTGRKVIDSDATRPIAGKLAAFVAGLDDARFEVVCGRVVLPIYVRPPFISKPKKGHPLER